MNARRLLVAFAFTTVVAPAALAQDQATSAAEALLDKMTGPWVMTGTIGKKPTTHDVDVDWVLKREYIRIHEVSRDKDASGGIGYEAWIYLVWDAKTREYAVMWLDNTAATNFAYDRATDTWSWTIDNVDKSGQASPFAKVTLTRKK